MSGAGYIFASATVAYNDLDDSSWCLFVVLFLLVDGSFSQWSRWCHPIRSLHRECMALFIWLVRVDECWPFPGFRNLFFCLESISQVQALGDSYKGFVKKKKASPYQIYCSSFVGNVGCLHCLLLKGVKFHQMRTCCIIGGSGLKMPEEASLLGWILQDLFTAKKWMLHS